MNYQYIPLKYKPMQLLPDEKWKMIFGINDYQEYLDNKFIQVYLKPEVHEDVKESFHIVQRLVDLAYYEYQFWDVAGIQSFLAFELALKLRYWELNGQSAAKLSNLYSYIKWFKERGAFETDNDEFLSRLREIRNLYAHPSQKSLAGPVIAWHITATTYLINDLYEDAELRVQRKAQCKDLNEKCRLLTKSGALLTDAKGNQYLVWAFSIGFLNNKRPVPVYYFYYQPIFKIPKAYKKGDSIPIYPVFEITCRSIEETKHGITGLDENGNKIFELTADLGEHQAMAATWIREFDTYLTVLPFAAIAQTQTIPKRTTIAQLDFYKQDNQE